MEIKEILKRVDHTLLKPESRWEQIRTLCQEAMEYHCASACIPACYVRQAKDFVGSKLAVCTVIGFPNGYSTTAVKCYEASKAIEDGADEIDMVANIGWIKDQKWAAILKEIQSIKAVCGRRILKVIIEACLLNRAEKIKMCEIISDAGADFIKTSTGFSVGGATREDVALFAQHIAPHVKIKAAGGIATLQDAQDFIALGAARLGTSRLVQCAKELGI